MANFTITVPDDKVDRILAAFGHRGTVPPFEGWVPATPTELRAMIKSLIQNRVNDYEKLAVIAAKDAQSATELW